MSEASININITSLKKRYSYYKKILDTKGELNEAQKKAFDEVKAQLGEDNIPKPRHGKLSDEEKKENRRKYYQEHKEEIKNYSAEWNKKNRDKVAAYNKKSYELKKAKKSEKKSDKTNDKIELKESDFDITA